MLGKVFVVDYQNSVLYKVIELSHRPHFRLYYSRSLLQKVISTSFTLLAPITTI